MKIIKIGAVWCGGCLVMQKTWKNIEKKYQDLEITSLDYDMDSEEVEQYHIGDYLPVIIFFKNDVEVKRINGEISEEKLIKVIEEIR